MRTSENYLKANFLEPLSAKFAEHPFYEVG